MWLGTGPTLNQVDLDRRQVTHHTPEFAENGDLTIHSLYRDRAGFIWLGLSNKSLSRFDPATGQFSPYQLPEAPPPIPPATGGRGAPPGPPPGPAGPPTEVVGLYEDHEGALWVAVIRDGLYRLDPQRKSFQVFRQPPGGPRTVDDPHSVATNEISALAEDRAGNIWLGHAFGVLSRLNPYTQTFDHYLAEPPLGWIEAIYVDQAGLVWVASRRGLVRFDPATETFKRYTEQDGLPTAFVVDILEDQAGNLWLSTKKGLSKFDPHQETFRNYDALDGLQGNEFMPRSSLQAPDGRMFFGGANGLTTFYPEQISDNPYPSPVILTEFRLFNEPILPGVESFLPQPIWDTDHLTLDYDQEIISLEFASLSYAAPHKNRYRYRLEGFEADWNEVDSTRRSAAYTNLPAGNYVFRVQGTNSDGVWSDQEVTLTLTILPPWWETAWFRGIGILLIGGLVYSGYRWRIHTIEQHNRLLELQVAERTRDLLEREEQLRQAKEVAEAANQAKSSFLASMSHELRSPLNAILGFTQIIRRNHTLPQEMHENLGIIMRSGEHLLTLINQVLDLSKIEAGHMTLDEIDFDLYHMLDDLEDMFSLKAEDKQLQLIFDRPDDLPRYIRTDEVKLRQVLINLLGNALKFTERGGVTLRVGIKGQGLGGRDQAQESASPLWLQSPIPIYFEVEDTGPGVALDEMDSLFEAFAQTETGRQIQEGTGLGLPISRKFIQLMGGDITVKSQVGNGTIFSFYIQGQVLASIETRHSKLETRIIALEPGQPRYRILVVDDKWTNRQLLIKLLNPLGFELREAQNGQEALAIWQEFEPHLIWMDMRMPVMDGFEATRRIKTTTKGQATAIIALTASSFEEERAIVLSSGCDGFVRKPFREREIFEMMSKHIGVRYIYETLSAEAETTTPLLPDLSEDLEAEIALLPPELLRQLTEGTELGDMELIDQAIIKIRHHHPALAEGLARLARNFEYDKLLELLQRVYA
jgi:signal transduction histidine kinase/CheY-like chemotaxis protein/streptogramin lyase